MLIRKAVQVDLGRLSQATDALEAAIAKDFTWTQGWKEAKTIVEGLDTS